MQHDAFYEIRASARVKRTFSYQPRRQLRHDARRSGHAQPVLGVPIRRARIEPRDPESLRTLEDRHNLIRPRTRDGAEPIPGKSDFSRAQAKTRDTHAPTAFRVSVSRLTAAAVTTVRILSEE